MNKEAVLRCFCAIGLSDEVRTALARVQRELSATEVPVRWVPPSNAHITLGRGQRRQRGAALTLPLDSYRNISFGNMLVSRVSLMHSERVQGGIRYSAHYKAVLKGAGKDGQG